MRGERQDIAVIVAILSNIVVAVREGDADGCVAV